MILVVVCVVFSILFFVGFVHPLLIKPYLRSRWYSKTYGKRCVNVYYPLLGTYNVKHLTDSFKKYGDSLKWMRNLIQHDHDAQFILGYSSIDVIDADLVKDITFTNIRSINKAGNLEFKDLLFGQGIIYSEGEKWKKQRAILAHSFSYDVIKSRIPSIDSTTRTMVSQIETHNGEQPVHIQQECQKITAEIIMRSFFGERFAAQKHEGQNLGLCLTRLVLDVMAQTLRYRILLPKIFLPIWTRKFFYDAEHEALKQRVISFRQLIIDEVNLRIDNYEKAKADKDFLDILVEEYQKNLADPNGEHQIDSYITKTSIIDQFLVFFFAGMETTGNLCSMMIYWLSKRCDILEKVRKEVSDVLGSNTAEIGEITDEQIKKLSYCHMFIHEVLRYHCPSMLLVPRIATEDFIMGGDILVKKGMHVNVSIHGILRREKYFENADEFNPERFSEENKRKINHLAFIPFSSGTRNCIGQHMALIEAKILLVHFVRNFDISLNEDVPLRMQCHTNYAPVDDRLVFLKRKQPNNQQTQQTKQQNRSK